MRFRTEKFRERLVLEILFGIFVILILLIFIFHSVKSFMYVKKSPVWAVAIDISKSMGLKYKENISRTEYAEEITTKIRNNLFDKINNKEAEFKWYVFGKDSEKISYKDIINISKNYKEGTNIYNSLRQIIIDNDIDRLKGIILITDGGQTEEDMPNAEMPKTFIFPAFNGSKFQDVYIKEVIYPEIMIKDQPDTVTVLIGNSEYDGEKAGVQLLKDNKIEDKKYIVLTKGTDKIEFNITENKPGHSEYKVIVDRFKNDYYPENNIFEFNEKTIKDKIRIMCISGRPRWEYKFLRTLLKRDPKVELVSFVILREPQQKLLFREDELSLIQFPIKRILYSQLGNFDLLVFDNFDYSKFRYFFPAYYLNQIEKYVNNGGAFLILGGSKSFNKNYIGTAVDRISPLKIRNSHNNYVEQSFKMKVPLQSYHHPILGGVLPEEWNDYPNLIDFNITDGIKEGAVVLGVNSDIKTDKGEDMPIIAVRKFGKGRVMAFATGSSFRWNFISTGEGKANTHYYKFFHNAVRWLVRNPGLESIKINIYSEKIRTEEIQRIDVLALNEFYQPIKDVKIITKIKSSTGKIFTLGLKSSDRGKYTYSFKPLNRGIYTVSVSVYKSGKLIKKMEKNFNVFDKSKEFSEGAGNLAVINNIAEKSSGKIIYNDADMKVLMQYFNQSLKTKYNVIENILHWWDNLIVLIIGVSIIILHWLLRKRWTGR